MNKIILSLSLLAVFATAAAFLSQDYKADDYFSANVEALAATETSGRAKCYNQIMTTTTSRVLECVSCEMKDGLGLNIGGRCKW